MKKKKKIAILIFELLILVALLVFFTLWLCHDNNAEASKKITAVTVVDETPEPTTTPAPTTEPVAELIATPDDLVTEPEPTTEPEPEPEPTTEPEPEPSEPAELYVLISLSEQHLWVREAGEVIFETDVVTGLATDSSRKASPTPPGEFTISQKARHAVLMNNARSDYWMRFNGGIGLHDAQWRSDDEFGGDTYVTNGSHGCVNLPLAAAKEIYDLVEVGTVVIVKEE